MTRPERFKFVGVLAVIALVTAMVSTCASCAPHTTSSYGRSAPEMHQSTVTIRTVCSNGVFAGSGVMVSPTRILTAGHVVRCQISETSFEPPLAIGVDGGDDEFHFATLDSADFQEGVDVAALTVDGMRKYFTPVTIGPQPDIGERVCASTGRKPRYAIKCGTVQPRTTADDTGTTRFDGIIEGGNSGSGLYDSRGRLVGIVTFYFKCSNGQTCGGGATPLWTRRDHLGI